MMYLCPALVLIVIRGSASPSDHCSPNSSSSSSWNSSRSATAKLSPWDRNWVATFITLKRRTKLNLLIANQKKANNNLGSISNSSTYRALNPHCNYKSANFTCFSSNLYPLDSAHNQHCNRLWADLSISDCLCCQRSNEDKYQNFKREKRTNNQKQ